MKSLMKAFVISAALVCGVVSSALASDWTYANNQITEVLPEGSGRRTPWILRTVVREDGALTVGNENGSSFNNAPVQTGDSGGMVDLSGTVSDGTTTYAIKGIGTAAFRGNTTITGLKLPTGFDKINTAAFYGCSNLATVEPFLPDTLTYLGWAAFRCCGKLKCDLVLSNPALSMGSGAQYNDGTFYQSGITSADLSAVTLESLPKQCFRESAIKWVKLPKGFTTFDATFHMCRSLADIEFSSLPTSIGGDVFQYGLAMPNSRFTYPANIVGWDTLIKASSFKPWADAGSANQQTYNTNFPDGPEPIGYCTIGGSVKWAVPIEQAVTERRLTISGVLTTGEPYNVGTVTPGYHASEVLEDATLACSAPPFAVDGTYGYRCVGYRIGKLAETTYVFGDLVESTSCTFEESETGEYVLQWCWAKEATRVFVGTFPEVLGTVRISGDFYQGYTDYFANGDTATVTATATNGAPFEMWFGDVSAAEETDNPLALTVGAPKTVVPYFSAKWTLNAAGNSVSDDYWTFPVSGTRDALTVCSPMTAGLAGMLDFTKGIEGGGAFAAVANMLFYNNNYRGGVMHLRLPDGMTAIADNSFRGCSNLLTVRVSPNLISLGTASFCDCSKLKSFEPFTFPKLTFLGHAAFRYCSALHQDLVLNNRSLRLGLNLQQDWDWGQFYGSGITSADLSAATMSDLSYQTFRECRQMTVVKLPKGLARLEATFHLDGALKDIQFQSFPTNFTKSSDSFTGTPSYGRIVYPKGEAGWEAYIAEQKAGDNFTAWNPASARAQAYLAAFPDQWKPIGAMTVHGIVKWLVPHNFDIGMKVLFW